MQEEIEQKSFNLMISTTKLSARTVLRAIKAALRLYQSKASQGKQSVRTLLRQNRGVSSVEISKTGIRGLERYAKKYGIDYAIRKDTSEVPPRYTAFLTRSCWSLPAMPGQSTASTARCLSTGRFLMPIWNASMNLQEKLPWRRSRTSERQCVDVL